MPIMVSPPEPPGPPLPLPAATGDAENLQVGVQRLELLDGSVIEPPAPGVTVVVGPNNVGKSTLLRQLNAWMQRQLPDAALPGVPLLGQVRLDQQGDSGDLAAWLNRHAHLRRAREGQPYDGYVRLGAQTPLPPHSAHRHWQHGEQGLLGQLHPFFVHYSTPGTRLEAKSQTGRRGSIEDHPFAALHYLEDDAELLHRLSAVSQEHLRVPLTLDWLSGQLQLRVGRLTLPAPVIDNIPPDYRRALGALRPLDEQGDGLRSFIALLLPLLVRSHPIVLIDEPEAFLHPPQATALGQELGRLARDGGLQLLLATHDRNLLVGLLGADVPVSVVRLDRHGDRTTAHQLDPDQLRRLWRDASLRYSNLLDGLFHRLVVLTEADRDARFYAAAYEAAHQQQSLPVPPSEVLFVPTGSKDRLAALARALRALAVEVRAIADLDVLRDESTVRDLVCALGGDWQALAPDYARATAPLRKPSSPRRVGDVRPGIQAALGQDDTAPFDSPKAEAIRAQLRNVDDPWRLVKDQGVGGFPRGEPTIAVMRLLDGLQSAGVVAARVGELEGFGRDVAARKGDPWLAAALEQGCHAAQATLEHVRRLLPLPAEHTS